LGKGKIPNLSPFPPPLSPEGTPLSPFPDFCKRSNKNPIAFKAGGEELDNNVTGKNWIVYFLEFPNSRIAQITKAEIFRRLVELR
jgi:hypothetical protein